MNISPVNEQIPTAKLKQFALDLGFQSCGVCLPVQPPHYQAYRDWLNKDYQGQMSYLRRHLVAKASPESLLPGVQSVVAVALNYNQPSEVPKGGARIARYALGRDYHKVLRGKLRRLAAFVVSQHPGAECRSCVDSAPIMERDYAQLAGLGWFGKNTCLIDSRRGSWFFIGLLLTTAPFQTDEPAVGSCGTCRACIDACPTGAIVHENGRWQVDARQCISYLTIEHHGALPGGADLHGWTFGCDVCQEVCPFNQSRAGQPMRAAVTAEPDFLAHRQWPGLRELAVIQEGQWDRLTVGSAVRRAGLEGLRRNAIANLEQEV